MSKSEFTILEELVLTIDKIGIEKTLEIIKNSRNLAKDKDIILQEYIIESVCNAFSISKRELLKGKSSLDKTNALAICSVELKGHLGYSQGRIASILKKHDSVVSKYIKKITYLDSNHQEDKRILEKLDIIEVKVRDFKNNIINKNL
jgi:hypothetical protein